MKTALSAEHLNGMQPFGVCVVDRETESRPGQIALLFVCAVTFAQNPEQAVRRVRKLYEDTRADTLHALPVFHPAVKQLLAADDEHPLTPTAAIAKYALIEAELAVRGYKARVRAKTRRAPAVPRVKVAGPDAVTARNPRVRIDPFTVRKTHKVRAELPVVLPDTAPGRDAIFAAAELIRAELKSGGNYDRASDVPELEAELTTPKPRRKAVPVAAAARRKVKKKTARKKA